MKKKTPDSSKYITYSGILSLDLYCQCISLHDISPLYTRYGIFPLNATGYRICFIITHGFCVESYRIIKKGTALLRSVDVVECSAQERKRKISCIISESTAHYSQVWAGGSGRGSSSSPCRPGSPRVCLPHRQWLRWGGLGSAPGR